MGDMLYYSFVVTGILGIPLWIMAFNMKMFYQEYAKGVTPPYNSTMLLIYVGFMCTVIIMGLWDTLRPVMAYCGLLALEFWTIRKAGLGYIEREWVSAVRNTVLSLAAIPMLVLVPLVIFMALIRQ